MTRWGQDVSPSGPQPPGSCRILQNCATSDGVSLSIFAQVGSPNHVDVGVALALQAVSPEVGEDPEAVRGEPPSHVHRHLAQLVHYPVAPHFALPHVLLGYCQKHQGHPSELVDDDDDIVVYVPDPGRGTGWLRFRRTRTRKGWSMPFTPGGWTPQPSRLVNIWWGVFLVNGGPTPDMRSGSCCGSGPCGSGPRVDWPLRDWPLRDW